MLRVLNNFYTNDVITGLLTTSHAGRVPLCHRCRSCSTATRHPLRSRARLQSLDVTVASHVRSKSIAKDLPPLAPLDGEATHGSNHRGDFLFGQLWL